MKIKEFAALFDHTNLKPFATQKDIEALCEEARVNDFYTVCINPSHVKYAAEKLKGSNVKVCSVIGFPLGASKWNVKIHEALSAYQDGASEVDMVMNIGAFKDNKYDIVEREIKAVIGEKIAVPHGNDILVKVIIETCYLTKEEIKEACKIVSDAGADYIKTSTGFGPAGATVEDVRLMYITIQELKSGLKIKAAGGIDNLEKAYAMITSGASRLGCSKSVQILKEFIHDKVYGEEVL